MWSAGRSSPTFQFSQTPSANIPRSSFDRSHGHKTTFNSEWLVPVYVDEVLPGDTFNLKMTAFCRLQTPLFPTLDNAYLESFFFFVPNRLLWSHWENFNGQQANPGDSTSYTVPVKNETTSPAAGSLQDYFGLPIGKDGGGTLINHMTYNALHLRAYALIFNEWFRDQNLQNSLTVDLGDGPDTTTNTILQNRGKRHDYFTSCLPWPQKTTAQNVLLGNTAVVQSSGGPDAYGRTAMYMGFQSSAGANPLVEANTSFAVVTSSAPGANNTPLTWPVSTDTGFNYANLAGVNPTINQLRQSVQIQRMYERDARGGTRYTEILRSHFGVISPDARLQRPEFLGGGRQAVNVHPVAQTSATGVAGTTTHLGDLAAFGVSSGSNHGFTKSFVEHGVILGIVNVRADQTYQQGMNRMWLRQSRFDFFWPSLAHLGEQAVTNAELYYVDNVTNPSQNAAAFGYQERYAEYRYKPSYTSGEFRSNYSTPLDSWHYAYQFTSLPSLNATFIQAVDFIGRTLAVPSQPFFLADFWFNLRCARPIPVRSIPGMMDRF